MTTEMLSPALSPEGDADFANAVAQWYDPFMADAGQLPAFPPVDYVLSNDITGTDPETGEIPDDVFNRVALPRLREVFPSYYDAQRQRVEADQGKIEKTPEESFEIEARMLRILIDAGETAVADAETIHADHAILTLDNDQTVSRKFDSDKVRFQPVEFDRNKETWDALGKIGRNQAFVRGAMNDVEATITRPAVIVGAPVLKELYGDKLHLGMVTSNVQDYLDVYCQRLNKATDEAFDPDLMISFKDGRFAGEMQREIAMTYADKNASPEERSHSPSLRDLLSSDFSPVYEDAERYVNLDDPEARSVSSQDIKLGILLRLKEAFPVRVAIVHIDDVKSTMRDDVPGARFVSIPFDTRFTPIENDTF